MTRLDQSVHTEAGAVRATGGPSSLGLWRRLWRRFVSEPRAEADEAAREYRARRGDSRASRDTAVIVVTVAVSLTVSNFWSDATSPGWLVSTLRALGLDGVAQDLGSAATTSTRAEFNRLTWWATAQIGSYVLLPAVAIWTLLGGRLRDYGFSLRGLRAHATPYVVILAVALPFVAMASYSESFQGRYPFYDLAPAEGLWPYLWIWWAMYAAQFVALEFFFRGFMVLGLRSRIGYASVLVMLVPYNMIHYGKPMPEAFAAIVGGFVLGTLALRTRSIWLGAGVHIAVAGAMDVLALAHAGVLF